ncbi:MAG: hypothetical protein ACXWYP_02920, partial [Pseudonocardia sp.]
PGTAWALLLLSVAALVALVAGCGAPEYTYVTNSADRTYLKVPASWRPIDDKAMNDAIGFDPTLTEEERGLWFEAYDADAEPSPMHLFGPSAAAPAAFVGVQQIPESARGQFSLDRLRDLFYPVSPSAQEAAEMDPTSGVSDLALVADEVLTPGNGLRGVHSVFRYRVGDGPMQMMDQTAYLNDDASKLYMFFVRCSTECYEQRQKEIGNVVSSFTVRETT